MIGFSLQPDQSYLDLLAPVIEEADYLEVAPETLWRTGPDGRFGPNGFHRIFRAIKKPMVAHGVGLSLGTATDDAPRLRRWLDRIREDHEAFRFLWYTDHLGATTLDGRAITLPAPLPMTDSMAELVRARLLALQQVIPDVGFENAVFYFLFGRPLEEPAFFERILRAPGLHLLLDLHNLHTMSVNFGFDPGEYLARLDLTRVIELHVSGGSPSEPEWGASMRLDSHDAPVPEAVWTLLEEVAPRCPRLRGVTLERMEGTVAPEDAPLLLEELRRARGIAG